MNEISGAVSLTLTVWSSTFSTPPSRSLPVLASTSVPIRAGIELPSELLSHQRPIL
jgi:hypothetical protein